MMTDSSYTPRTQTERVIAAGRVVLTSFSLLAIWLDPSNPSKHAQVAYTLLSLYLAYAVLLIPWVWRSDAPMDSLCLGTHVVDLFAFTLFMYFTEGPTSPFFVYFVFAVLAAALRWQWRGTLWTGLIVLVIFVGVGSYIGYGVRDPAFELNRFIIRGVYLAVVAILLAYLTAFQQRLRTEMSRLADWPRELPQELEALVREELSHMAHIFGAPRVFMAWDEPDEPWLYLATHFNGEFRVIRESPTAFQPLVPEPLADAHFLCLDARAPPCTVIYKLSAGIERWHGAPVHPGLQDRFSIRSVLSFNLQGKSLSGRLFVLDKPWITIDALTLGGIVARLVRSDIDRFYLQRRLQQGAVAEERVRLARNLHDGLLQSLTAAALQLETARRLLEQDPQAACQCIQDIQTLILAEQRDLRSLVQQMKPVPVSSGGESTGLEIRLEEFAQRIARQWGLQVEVTLEPRTAPFPDELAHEIYRIVQEALVNAARHANASVVRVQFGIEDDEVHITVTDDGYGFPFRGRYDLAALTAMSMGPVSLKQRLASLRGQLSIDSSETGSRLEIMLPFG